MTLEIILSQCFALVQPPAAHDLFGVLKSESSTDVCPGKQWKPIWESGPCETTVFHPQPRVGTCRTVLFGWASRKGRSRAAMGWGCSRLLREDAQQHPHGQVKGSAGLSP